MSGVHHFVRAGRRDLAARVVTDAQMNHPFNELHKQVLSNTDGRALNKFMPVSCKKKAHNNQDITPMHCACINPDSKYLKVPYTTSERLQ